MCHTKGERGGKMSEPQSMRRQQYQQVCGSWRRTDLMAALQAITGAPAPVPAGARAAVVHSNEVAMLMSVVALAPLRMVGVLGESPSDRLPHLKARTAP